MPRSSPMPQVAALEAQIARLEAQLRDSQESLANLQSLEPSRRRSGSTSFESGQRFRALAMHSPIGIYQCDTAGRCLFVNERYCSIAGLPLSECAESGWLRTLHPDDRENVLAAGREAHASGSGFTTEHRFLHADGTVRWVLGSAVALKGFRGEVTGYIGSVLDITHRKQAVAALVASEQRFRLLSNCSPVGIFLADEAGNLIYANPRLHAICGCNSQEQLLGLGFANMIHPNECDAAIANWLRLAPTSDLHNLERKMLNPDGKTRWVHVHSAPLISEAGDVLGRVGTIEDITDSRESHERLRVSEERYRLLAEYSTDMTSEHTFEGIYRYASPACRALLGYEPEELVGKRARDLFHPDDLSALREMSQATAEPFGVTTVEYRIRHKDGRYIWFETVSKSIPDPAVEGAHSIHAVSRDITIRRQAAERLRDSEARMRAILDTAVDGIITVDDSGVVEMFNPGAERLLGYRSEEVVGQSVRMLMSKHDDSGEQQARTLAGFRRAS